MKAECGREHQVVSVLVLDSGELAEVWVELDPVHVPHRELFLGIPSVRAPFGGVPRPDLVGIQGVQVSL